MAVEGKISSLLKFNHSLAYDLGGRLAAILAEANLTFESGTGDNQVDLIFSDQRTLTASSTESLDLAGGLTDAFGASLTFAKLKLIYIKAALANSNNIIIGNVSNGIVGPFGAATHSLLVKPGGLLLWACPKTGETVTASTGDLLKVANAAGGTSVTYDIVVAGTSA